MEVVLKNRIIIGIFLFFIYGMSIATLIGPKRNFSEMENRYLAKAPDWSVTQMLNGQFSKGVETYMSDHIFGKDTFMKLKTRMDQSIGKIESNQVYFADDGYLLGMYKEDTKQITKNVNLINKWLQNINKKTYFMLIPNAIDIMEDKLPFGAWNDSQEKTRNFIKDNLSNEIIWVDPRPILMEHKKENLYFKTDHHWTMQGAFYGVQAFTKVANLKMPSPNEYHLKILTDNFLGSQYSKVPTGNSVPEQIAYFERNNGKYEISYDDNKQKSTTFIEENLLEHKDKYAAFLGGNHGKIEIKSNGLYDKRILCIKDSYANCMIPFLSDIYRDVFVVDLRFFRGDLDLYIKENEIDEILFLYNVEFFNSDDNFLWLDQ